MLFGICECMYTMWVTATASRRRQQIPWNWIACVWLCAILWVLAIEPKSSIRANALNHWDIFQAPSFISLMCLCVHTNVCVYVCTFATCVQVLSKARIRPRDAVQVITTWLVWVQGTESRSSKKVGSILIFYSFSWHQAPLSAEPSSRNIIHLFLSIVIVESCSYSCDRFAFSLPVKNELMFLKCWLKQICRS